MATFNSIPAVFGVNKYLWDQFESAGIMDKKNYGGLVPIIPIQESAPFVQAMEAQDGRTQFPYVIYTWYTNSIGPDDWYKQSDTVIYTIYSTDQTALRQLFLMAVNHLKRYDESAEAVNRFVSRNLDAEKYGKYNYKHISVAAASAGTPTGYENDPTAATITVRLVYTDDENETPLVNYDAPLPVEEPPLP